VAIKPQVPASAVSLRTLKISSNSLPWGPFQEGCCRTSGGFQGSTSSISRSALRWMWWLSLKGEHGKFYTVRKLILGWLTSYSGYAIHLWSMTSGRPHPPAENPIISYPCRCNPEIGGGVGSVSITNYRLAILAENLRPARGTAVVVWDWRTGMILLVSEPLASVTFSGPTKILG